jgi:hypothetical protein
MTPVIINPSQLENFDWKHVILQIDGDGKSIGIDAIKSISQTTSLSSDLKQAQIILIKNAELMTEPAQNALLKTLESCAENVQIYICTARPGLLLDTIKSRTLNLVSSTKRHASKPANDNSLLKAISLSPAKITSFTDKQTKESALELINDLIYLISDANRQHFTKSRSKITKMAIEASNEIQRNQNYKLVLDHFLLKSHSLL